MKNKCYTIAGLPDPLVIGRQTETGVLEVRIDCTAWLSYWPELSMSIWVTPPGGSAAYPAATHMEDRVLVWSVNGADTAVEGFGTMEVVGLAPGQKKLSAIAKTQVLRTTTATTGDPPEPAQPWVDQVLAQTNAAASAANQSRQAAAAAAASAQEAAKYVGKDGVSPTVTLTEIEGGTTVTITDATGPHSLDVMHGQDGAPGQDGKDGKDAEQTLLINNDFRNPVNTSGLTEVTGAGHIKSGEMFVNGWSFYGTGTSFSLADGEIHAVNDGSATCGMAQKLPAEALKPGSAYTLACKARVTGTFVLSYGVTATANTLHTAALETGADKIHIFNFTLSESTDGFYNFRIRSAAEAATMDVEWLDLFEGTYTADTLPLHKTPNREIEAVKLGVYPHEHNHVAENFRHYIDGVNGDDTNNGLTPSTAFKTVTKWLSLCNKGRLENRCIILTAGEYDIPASCFAGLALHITGYVDGVVLNFRRTGAPSDCVFYGTHYNLDNLTLRFEHDECRFETCSLILSDCVFEAPLVTFYDCLVDAQTACTFPRVVMFGTAANLRYFVSTCTSGNALCLEKGSTARVYTSITFAAQAEGNTYAAFRVVNSTLWLEAGTINGSGFATGVYVESAIVGLTPSRYALLSNLATTPTAEFATKPSLFIAGTTVIGGEYA